MAESYKKKYDTLHQDHFDLLTYLLVKCVKAKTDADTRRAVSDILDEITTRLSPPPAADKDPVEAGSNANDGDQPTNSAHISAAA